MVSRRELVAAAAGTTAVGAVIALPALARGSFYAGTQVQGIDLSGLDRTAGEEVLRAAFTPLEDLAVTYTFEGQEWPASLTDLGFIVDYETMVREAWTEGRGDNVIERYQILLDQGKPHNVPLRLLQDDLKLDAFLANIGEQIAIAPRNARLVRSGTAIDILQDQTGRQLDLAAVRQATVTAVSTGRSSTIELVTVEVPADVAADDLAGAREDAILLVGEPVIFTHDGNQFDIDTEELTGALMINSAGQASLDLEKLDQRMTDIANAVLVPPRNVTLGWEDGIYVIEDDVDGVGVDMESFQALLMETARKAERTVELPTQVLKAAARTDNVSELGLEEHLAYGSSSFAGSSETRYLNILAAADNVSYKMVGPGEKFSFNDQMGPISLDNGFVEGSIIQGDWTASDLGGGVCQVSTTVFRAALRAGFKFDEWYAHGWRLPFYEADGSPPGMDAAIYQPNTEFEYEKDLIFENPLDSWLMLMMVVDGDTVTAHLYGRPNGWQTEVFEPRVSEPKEPGEPVEKVNPDLKPGERKRVQVSRPGYTVYLRRKVTDADGNVVSDGDFVSDYRSQPEAWEIGPGTPPAPTATEPAD
jgi:vancomycin resistance protein YoaR